ncbi:MAG: winged helix-turn-helix transcriptional regulator [Thermoplasmatota archaeon]
MAWVTSRSTALSVVLFLAIAGYAAADAFRGPAVAAPGAALPSLPPAATQGPAGETVDSVMNVAQSASAEPTSPNGGVSLLPLGPKIAFPDDALTVVAIGVGLAGLAGLAAFLGATRFATREEVLENEVRNRIYQYLRAHIGANLKQVTDDLRLTTTNAIWHLRKLEDAGLIHSRRFNGFKVFYPAEGGVEARRLSLSITALANGNAQEVFEFVMSNPGAHQREIARALGVNHGTVRWHLKKLGRAELLTEVKKGRASVYEATPLGESALKTVLEQQAARAASFAPATFEISARDAPAASPSSSTRS